MPGETERPVRGDGHTGPASDVYVCRHCDRAVVRLDLDGPVPQCHGEAMRDAGRPNRRVTRQALCSRLADAAGVPRSGCDVCYALLTGGITSPDAVADRIDRDPRTVRDHLDRLVAADLLDRSPLPREDGGTVAFYHLAGGAKAPTTLAEFCFWAGVAAGPPDAAPGEPDDPPATVFRDAFCPNSRESSSSRR